MDIILLQSPQGSQGMNPSIRVLVPELLLRICEFLDAPTLKSLRQVCVATKHCPARKLFEKLVFGSLDQSLKRLELISNHKEYSLYVRELTYVPNLTLPYYPSYQEWVTISHDPSLLPNEALEQVYAALGQDQKDQYLQVISGETTVRVSKALGLLTRLETFAVRSIKHYENKPLPKDLNAMVMCSVIAPGYETKFREFRRTDVLGSTVSDISILKTLTSGQFPVKKLSVVQPQVGNRKRNGPSYLDTFCRGPNDKFSGIVTLELELTGFTPYLPDAKKLLTILSATTRLESLSLSQFVPITNTNRTLFNVTELLDDITWPNLKALHVKGLTVDSLAIVDFVSRHSKTLVELRLVEINAKAKENLDRYTQQQLADLSEPYTSISRMNPDEAILCCVERSGWEFVISSIASMAAWKTVELCGLQDCQMRLRRRLYGALPEDEINGLLHPFLVASWHDQLTLFMTDGGKVGMPNYGLPLVLTYVDNSAYYDFPKTWYMGFY